MYNPMMPRPLDRATVCRGNAMEIKQRAVAIALALLTVLGIGNAGQALDYPNGRITLVVPFPPGGGNDAMARIMADRLSARLGQTVVVDNRGGAGGIVGTRSAAKAAPDGYTLLLGHTGSVGINPTLYRNAGFDTLKDFTPIGLIATMPLALLVHPSVQAKNVGELIGLAKVSPGTLNLGSSSKGTGSHMCAEMFMQAAGVKMNLIPYKGTAQTLTDLIGGHTQVTFTVIPPAFGAITSGQLRPLAVTSPQRSMLLPDVPTASESGLPGFDVVLNYGLLAPAGTPKAIVDKINQAMWAALADEEVKKRISADGAEAMSSTPVEYAAIVERDLTRWADLITTLNLKVD
ncbi:MAG: tripartite tricarboxylate transporter substrate binding protein [Rhizobiales bacterium]|nr:tripartite tricarboxylate transporter substrate binding protein [Hyphomicrobiales bacterium]